MHSRLFVTVVLALSLMGCEKTLVLHADLTEKEANEMLSLLFCQGLSAEKTLIGQESGSGGVYSVDTSEMEYQQATILLQSYDLPRKRFNSMGDLFQKTGLVSSVIEETARLNHALTEELSSTLSSIDGVRVARVHLSLPKKSSFTGKGTASSAAVFITHREDVLIEKSTASIKTLVDNSIENLSYDDVTVVFFPERVLACNEIERIARNEI